MESPAPPFTCHQQRHHVNRSKGRLSIQESYWNLFYMVLLKKTCPLLYHHTPLFTVLPRGLLQQNHHHQRKKGLKREPIEPNARVELATL